jgi:sigma-E factor negative regulatory protein RseB
MRQGYRTAVSVVLLLLLLAPGLFLITAADAQLVRGAAEPERADGQAVRPDGRAAAPSLGAAAGEASDTRTSSGPGFPGPGASPGSDDASGPGPGAFPGGDDGTRPGSEASPGGDDGIKLLRAAAEAGRTIPYRGVQVISWWGQQGTTTMVVNVTHQPGDGTLLQMAGTGAQPATATYVADTPGAQQPGTALGVTEESLDLLSANYRVVTGGTGTAGSRPAQIVEARRDDGTIAARFWLDQATKVPLRRELFGRQSRMINEDAFIDLEIGRSAVTGVLDGQAVPSRPWSDELTGADLIKLRARGWPLPGRLPGGLTLFDARETATASGPVLQLGYSDGLCGVSLFIQRGGLPGTLPGYQQVELAGHTVYARDSVQQLLTWAGRGHVYAVIADAPDGTVDSVVGALPHDAAPGFWERLSRGFARIASWMDPFG